MNTKEFQFLTKKWRLQIRSGWLLLKRKKDTSNPQARVFWEKPELHYLIFFFFFSSSAFEPQFVPTSLSSLWWWHSQLGSASSETVTSTTWPGAPGGVHGLPSCTNWDFGSKTAFWLRVSCQGWGPTPTIAWLIPLLPARWGVLGPVAAVHHSTSVGKTGLISNPPQSRSVLNPSKIKHFAS